MAQVTGTATYWNTPRYDGLLWTADVSPGQGTGTPFLTLIGGLNGDKARDVPDFDFAMTSEFDYPSPSQPSISETDSLTAPAAVSPVLDQKRNTCQIWQESVDVSYKKKSTIDRIATDIVQGGVGYWAQDGLNNQVDLVAQHTAYALRKIARNANYTFLNGVFVQSTSSAVAAQTRGIITAVSSSAVAADGATLSLTLLDSLFRLIAQNSGGQAYISTPILFVNAFQKQQIDRIYGSQPDDWNIGGVNIGTILTSFGRVGVVYESMVPIDTVLFASLSLCRPVFCPVSGFGRFVDEPLAKTGAAERRHIYSHIGIDYANEKLHGKITGLATS